MSSMSHLFGFFPLGSGPELAENLPEEFTLPPFEGI